MVIIISNRFRTLSNTDFNHYARIVDVDAMDWFS